MKKKRIILMYISDVSGHRSAAESVERALRQVSPQAEVLSINAFNYTNPLSEKIVNKLYMGVIQKMPGIWEYLYDNPRIVRKIERFKKSVHKFNSPKLKKLFDSFRPDVVACAQAFPCGMVADYKKARGLKLPLVAILTDYIPHAYWIYDNVDYYVVPSMEVAGHLAAKGVPEEKIKPFGIPFDPKFNEPVDKRLVFKKTGLDDSLPTVLIMGGGHGLGPINRIVDSLEKVKKDFQEVIVAGINKRLYKSLKNKLKQCRKRVLLLGYVNNIHELMSISDLIITKPGGVTTAEALVKNLPMVIVRPIPGQEASNTDFLVKKKAALKIDEIGGIGRVVSDLLDCPDKLSQLRSSAAAISKPRASLDIAGLILDI
ncbi:MAG: hypothetical protein JW788_03490 [Candidatus Omnitrophica bacterium]|nr:hypothetical protein [Candidatus Omnitrophota bacterium]